MVVLHRNNTDTATSQRFNEFRDKNLPPKFIVHSRNGTLFRHKHNEELVYGHSRDCVHISIAQPSPTVRRIEYAFEVTNFGQFTFQGLNSNLRTKIWCIMFFTNGGT